MVFSSLVFLAKLINKTPLMKDHEDYHQLPLHQRRFWRSCSNHLRSNNHRLPAYVILLILSYALGYFTASPPSSISSTSQPPTPPPHDTEIQRLVTSTTTTSTVNNCPPSTSRPNSIISILDKNNDHNRFGPVCSKPTRPEQIRAKIINSLYNGTSPYDDFPPPHVARLLQPKKVKGWGSYGAVFENLIRKTRPKTIIEVGTFLGASATHMADLTRKLGLKTQILCLDDFRGWPGFRAHTEFVAIENADVLLLAQFMQNVVHLEMSELIMPVPFSTGAGLMKLCELGIYGDLIEVDAGHDFHSAWIDINLAHKVLAPEGVMFGHDYSNAADNRGVRRAVDLFAKIHGFKVFVDGQHWVLHPI